MKLTALFPTNRSKPETASDSFFRFAVGECEIKGDKIVGSGPLFEWKACSAIVQSGQLFVGLTEDGYGLLRTLDGLTLEMPHPESMADGYLQFLQTHAQGDWWGFSETLKAVELAPTREELVQWFLGTKPIWTPAQAGTIAGGYVARAREWGLLEPKQRDGRYSLTSYGKRLVELGRTAS